MSTIPASHFVAVTPAVLAAGGTALELNGLVITTNTRPPVGTVPSFPDSDSVSDFFGATSTEKTIADKYFNGFDNSPVKPGAILFAQYPASAVFAYLRGGDVSAMTLAQIQALNAALSVTIDSVVKSATINLAAATSKTSAAQLIATGLAIHGTQTATFTASVAGSTMTVTAVGTGALAVGQEVSGTVAAGTYITAQLTGTAGSTGTYTVTPSPQTVGSASQTAYNPAVSYDSVSGGFVIASGTTGATSTITVGSGALASSLLLTAVGGAVLSQGAAAGVPATFMDALVSVTQNWATFMTAFNPDSSGNTVKLAFAAWANNQDDRYAYVCWDNDTTPALSNSATTSMGFLLASTNSSGTVLIGQDAADASDSNLIALAAFVCGMVASIDFERTNGRTDAAYRSQTGLSASVTNLAAAANLEANGYNYYGAVATANDGFQFFYPGSITGPFLWLDSFIDQIWLNNQFQLALMVLLTNAPSIPYNSAGYAQIESALSDPIQSGLNFGAFRPGVTLSASQISAINAEAGANIAPSVSANGYYLQVKSPSPSVRQARGSPQCKFWYVDGQSVQKIDLGSVEVQ